MKNKVAFFFSLSLILLLTSCGYVKIGRILSDPAHFQHRTIRVNGTVIASYRAPAASTNVYEVADDTGSIYVVSRAGAPLKGTRVRVTGRVVKGLKVLGRSFSAAIREREHKLR